MSTFSDWIAEFGEGALDDELTAHLMEVATAVRLHGKAGSLTLKLKFGEKGGGVIVDADVSSTAPQTKPSAFFYVDEKNALSGPHAHREAFALMQYESAETPAPSVRRLVWNSRDGVTPFGFTDPTTGIRLNHVRWSEDRYAPDHVPDPDQLVFVTERGWPALITGAEFAARSAS